ncbi:malonyl-CoA O-methyltransferase [Lebetimonas natsushimae]|uniref:Malonyl-CoA O-methyltransferase n=1 Tax=Lebetimonas natsushimae TaxID=1936991 RepID=A0A292YB19_9BACT|nr:methyltransferase domain-containing protein [Lebetimonas natsushimae]GAX86706.1 malonyl-CoA O-methyltransferase [Lebetimonas natsushimae]
MNFDKFAHTYSEYNLIQKKIIENCLPFVKEKVIDLGCGNGIICKYKKFDFYLGIDISEKMLQLHPCKTLKLDFNTKECFNEIKKYDFEQIISFSALQWAKDLDFVFKEIKNLNKNYLLAVFSSNTFKLLHNYLGIQSPIYSKEKILKSSQILNPEIKILNYVLNFDNPVKLLEYIKYSGVSGNVRADIGKLKKFIKNFPINILEFEILLLKSK